RGVHGDRGVGLEPQGVAGAAAASCRAAGVPAEDGVQEVPASVDAAAVPDPQQWPATDLPSVGVQRVGVGSVAQRGGAAPLAPHLTGSDEVEVWMPRSVLASNPERPPHDHATTRLSQSHLPLAWRCYALPQLK